eukprot:TRINITY_DN3766_c0_g2_i1.p1 TRINITY_DN3766_c0_g2~~TRINITY_DN3766_c0_g2_i1.p1  ORF type:complete len:1774 (+),score=565.66 TRINITY_DN3766_c0_g2_i1:1129-6450(+)
MCEECQISYYAPYQGLKECLPCPLGTYNDFRGMWNCTVASPGYYVDEPHSDRQKKCPEDTYSEQGATQCKSCASDSFPNPDQSGCWTCPPNTNSAFARDAPRNYTPFRENNTVSGCVCNEFTVYRVDNCTKCGSNAICSNGIFQGCNPGYYPRTTNQETTCVACPVGASCTGRGEPEGNAGYWQSLVDPHFYYACDFSQGCIGTSQCQPGYTSVVCSVCDVNNYFSGHTCLPCPEQRPLLSTGSVLGVAAVALFCVLLAYQMIQAARENETHRAAIDKFRNERGKEMRRREAVLRLLYWLKAQKERDLEDVIVKEHTSRSADEWARVIQRCWQNYKKKRDLSTLLRLHHLGKLRAKTKRPVSSRQLTQQPLNDTGPDIGGATAIKDHAAKSKSRYDLHERQSSFDLLGGPAEKNKSFIDQVLALNLIDAACVRILIAYIQVFSQITTTFKITWPTEFSDFVKSMKFINLDYLGAVSGACTFGLYTGYYYVGFFALLVGPVVVLAAFYGILVLLMIIIRVVRTRKGSWPEVDLDVVMDIFLKWTFTFLFVFYIEVSVKMLQYWKCVEIDGGQYLEADFSIQCWTGMHLEFVPMAVIGTLVYPVGVPVLFFIVLRKHETIIKETLYLRELNKLFQQREQRKRKANDEAMRVAAEEELAKADKAAVLGKTADAAAESLTGDAWSGQWGPGLATAPFAVGVGLAVLRKTDVKKAMEADRQSKIDEIPLNFQIKDSVRYVKLHKHRLNAKGEPLEVMLKSNEEIAPERLFERARTSRRYGSLYSDFHAANIFWGVSDVWRRLFLTSVIIYIRQGTAPQLGIGVLVNVVFMVLHAFYRAYKDKKGSILNMAALTAIALSLFAGVLIKAMASPIETADWQLNIVSFFLVIINSAVVALAGVLIIAHFVISVRKAQAKRHELNRIRPASWEQLHVGDPEENRRNLIRTLELEEQRQGFRSYEKQDEVEAVMAMFEREEQAGASRQESAVGGYAKLRSSSKLPRQYSASGRRKSGTLEPIMRISNRSLRRSKQSESDSDDEHDLLERTISDLLREDAPTGHKVRLAPIKPLHPLQDLPTKPHWHTPLWTPRRTKGDNKDAEKDRDSLKKSGDSWIQKVSEQLSDVSISDFDEVLQIVKQEVQTRDAMRQGIAKHANHTRTNKSLPFYKMYNASTDSAVSIGALRDEALLDRESSNGRALSEMASKRSSMGSRKSSDSDILRGVSALIGSSSGLVRDPSVTRHAPPANASPTAWRRASLSGASSEPLPNLPNMTQSVPVVHEYAPAKTPVGVTGRRPSFSADGLKPKSQVPGVTAPAAATPSRRWPVPGSGSPLAPSVSGIQRVRDASPYAMYHRLNNSPQQNSASSAALQPGSRSPTMDVRATHPPHTELGRPSPFHGGAASAAAGSRTPAGFSPSVGSYSRRSPDDTELRRPSPFGVDVELRRPSASHGPADASGQTLVRSLHRPDQQLHPTPTHSDSTRRHALYPNRPDAHRQSLFATPSPNLSPSVSPNMSDSSRRSSLYAAQSPVPSPTPTQFRTRSDSGHSELDPLPSPLFTNVLRPDLPSGRVRSHSDAPRPDVLGAMAGAASPGGRRGSGLRDVVLGHGIGGVRAEHLAELALTSPHGAVSRMLAGGTDSSGSPLRHVSQQQSGGQSNSPPQLTPMQSGSGHSGSSHSGSLQSPVASPAPSRRSPLGGTSQAPALDSRHQATTLGAGQSGAVQSPVVQRMTRPGDIDFSSPPTIVPSARRTPHLDDVPPSGDGSSVFAERLRAAADHAKQTSRAS